MSSITPPTETINYPDILGLVTGNARVNLDVVQCALTTRPAQVAAGQPFEALLLLQNASDANVDVTIELQLPKQSMFYSKSSRLLVGLQPAEVGYIILPLASSPKTKPAPQYIIGANIKVDRLDKGRKPTRIRQPNGGGQVVAEVFSEERRQELLALRHLRWHAHAHGHHLETCLEILPPTIAMPRDFKAGWVSLWTLKDHLDTTALKERLQQELEPFMSHLTKEEMTLPLLEATQNTFQKAHYPLQPAEALFITKLLTLVLCEIGVEQPSRINPNPLPPQWYTHLLHILYSEPRLHQFPVKLVTGNLYFDLVYDAVLHGFKMLKAVLNEDFGTPDEMHAYADGIRAALRNGSPLSYDEVYLPLIMGGVIANNRVSVEHENIRESLFNISKAHDSRASERTPDNQFIADLMKKLVDRSIDYIGAM